MINDFEIGQVVNVETAQVRVQLNTTLGSMTRNTSEGVKNVGQINSYITIPIGEQRLIGMVTRVALSEGSDFESDDMLIIEVATKMHLSATLIGTIENGKFTQGISIFPVLGTPVYLSMQSDIEAIFGNLSDEKTIFSSDTGYRIPIGTSAIVENRSVLINPDAFFGKHAAVLGSTGTGKSCTIASIMQSIIGNEQVQRSLFIIFDINGEYRSAFQKRNKDSNWDDIGENKCSYISSDPNYLSERLIIPYWFMNAEEFSRIFRAASGVQKPLLFEALRLARNDADSNSVTKTVRDTLIFEFNRILTLTYSEQKTSKDVRNLAEGLIRYIDHEDYNDIWQEFEDKFKVKKSEITDTFESIQEEAGKHVEAGTYPMALPLDVCKFIEDSLNSLISKIGSSRVDNENDIVGISADTPVYFDKNKFRLQYIERVLSSRDSGVSRSRDHIGTMLLRIDRLFSDRRFDFLFGNFSENMPEIKNVLASFIRDIVGLVSNNNNNIENSNNKVSNKVLPFVDRQLNNSKAPDVVILDLSLLDSEVLENITALIGRLLLEFLQRLGEYGGVETRGSLPIVLVLEEAHNFVSESNTEDSSVSRTVFEKIAREGRKYGLGLVVASQRPSELSKTVLSQCNSFIVHRLQNPEDIRYFRDVVPGIYKPIFEQLPALAPQTALVLGECVSAPMLVKIRDVNPRPRSDDPKFYDYWVRDKVSDVPVEEICAIWEGKNFDGNLETEEDDS